MTIEQELAAAWQRIDQRTKALQRRHRDIGDIPLYDDGLNPPASNAQLLQLKKAFGMDVPIELAYSLKRWNGRWIAHDHMISLSPVADHIYMSQVSPWQEEYADETFEQVFGPINPLMNSRKRFCIGGHEGSGEFLYLDYENPPKGGRLGQVIRIGEEPTAQYIAGSFVEFLNMVAAAPVYDDNPDFDPLLPSASAR